MYRVVMYALWSRDYVSPLAKLFEEVMGIANEDAMLVFERLSQGKPQAIVCSTPGLAYDLSCDLMQFGVYSSSEQIGPITPAIIASDMDNLMHEDLSMFWVFRDEKGQVQRLIQKNTLGFLYFESLQTAQLVGKTVEERGGERIGKEHMDEIMKQTEDLREARIVYAKRMTSRYGRDWKRIPWSMREGHAQGTAIQETEEE